MSKLKPCPCGQVPPDFGIEDCGSSPKYAQFVPSCCSEWNIEFRTNYYDYDSEECRKLAIRAWNEAPRGFTDE